MLKVLPPKQMCPQLSRCPAITHLDSQRVSFLFFATPFWVSAGTLIAVIQAEKENCMLMLLNNVLPQLQSFRVIQETGGRVIYIVASHPCDILNS